MGDDLILLSGINVYPIVRPLCIYPEHKNIQNLENFLNKLKERNTIVLKIKRKVLSYLASFFPKLEFIFFKSFENEYSSVSWAYISPKRLGLNIYLRCESKYIGFIALVKKDNNIKISNNKSDIVQGILYEFNSYEKELNFLSQTFHKNPLQNTLMKKLILL